MAGDLDAKTEVAVESKTDETISKSAAISGDELKSDSMEKSATTSQRNDPKAVAVLEIEALGEMFGADEAVIQRAKDAIQNASVEGNAVRQTANDVTLLIVVDGMTLPKEAAKAGLSASELMKFADTLAKIEPDDREILTNPKTYIQILNEGPEKGVDNIYKKSLGTKFGVPKELWGGMTSERMLNGISLSELLSDGQAATDRNYWDGLDNVQNGKGSKEDFLNQWSGGDYTNSPLDDFIGDDSVSDDGEQPIPDSPSGEIDENEWIDADDLQDIEGEWVDDPNADIPGAYGNVTHTPDGGFDISGYNENGDYFSEHFAPNGNGGFTGSNGGYSSQVPAEGTYGVSTGDDGATEIYVSTESGDDSADSGSDSDGTGDSGSDDDSSDDSDNGSSSDDSNDDSEADETPVPNQSDAPGHLLLWALMNAHSPAGQQVLGMIRAAVASAQNYGGKIDPIDEGSRLSGTALRWSLMNPKNPAAQAYLEMISQVVGQADADGGTDNNPDQWLSNLSHLAGSTVNVDFILAGGGLIDPVDSDGSYLWGWSPIRGPEGGTEAESDDEDGSFAINVDFLFTTSFINFDAFEAALA